MKIKIVYRFSKLNVSKILKLFNERREGKNMNQSMNLNKNIFVSSKCVYLTDG